MFTGLSTLRKNEKKTVEQTEESKKLQDYLQKYNSGEENACDLDDVFAVRRKGLDKDEH